MAYYPFSRSYGVYTKKTRSQDPNPLDSDTIEQRPRHNNGSLVSAGDSGLAPQMRSQPSVLLQAPLRQAPGLQAQPGLSMNTRPMAPPMPPSLPVSHLSIQGESPGQGNSNSNPPNSRQPLAPGSKFYRTPQGRPNLSVADQKDQLARKQAQYREDQRISREKNKQQLEDFVAMNKALEKQVRALEREKDSWKEERDDLVTDRDHWRSQASLWKSRARQLGYED